MSWTNINDAFDHALVAQKNERVQNIDSGRWVVNLTAHAAELRLTIASLLRPPHADIEHLDTCVEKVVAQPEHLGCLDGFGLQSIGSTNSRLVVPIVMDLDGNTKPGKEGSGILTVNKPLLLPTSHRWGRGATGA